MEKIKKAKDGTNLYEPLDADAVEEEVSSVLSELMLSQKYKHLIIGTIAVESDFGTLRRQHGFDEDSDCGAFGIAQVELETHNWLVKEYAYVTKDIEVKKALVKIYDHTKNDKQNLMYNDEYNIAVCALKYRSCSCMDLLQKFLLSKDNSEPCDGWDGGQYSEYAEKLARIWKAYYNTILGKGTVPQYIEKYTKYYLNRTKNKPVIELIK